MTKSNFTFDETVNGMISIICYMTDRDPKLTVSTEIDMKVAYLLSIGCDHISSSHLMELSSIISNKLNISTEMTLNLLNLLSLNLDLRLIALLALERYQIRNMQLIKVKANELISLNTEELVCTFNGIEGEHSWIQIGAFRQKSLNMSYANALNKASFNNISCGCLCEYLNVGNLNELSDSKIDNAVDSIILERKGRRGDSFAKI